VNFILLRKISVVPTEFTHLSGVSANKKNRKYANANKFARILTVLFAGLYIE